MNKTTKRVLFWGPRILCILFAVFVSLFALDVFGEGFGFWQTIIALVMHLIPTYVVVIALVIAWRWEWVGTIPLDHLLVDRRAAVPRRRSLWGQLAVQGRAANTIAGSVTIRCSRPGWRSWPIKLS